jgi:hypothetical protein
MKVRCYFKDPDTMPDCVDDAYKKAEKPEGLDDREWELVKEQRAEATKEHISDKWMDYSEYLMVEFDTDAGTATVLERGTYRS